jgi:hypothetical protein
MKTKKTLKIGRSDFELIVKNNHYFVDKTILIYDFYNNENDIILMPRPKRFGKTLNLSMIEHFFDIQKKESAGLFSEFEISEKKDFCKEHQNKYPVINISLKGIKATDWKSCYDKFKTEISDLYGKHEYLLKSKKLGELKKENFTKVLKEKASQAKFEYSLKHLSEYLKIHYEKEVIILVDEYDAPIINAFKNTNKPIKSIDKENKTYYENVISFMQTFLGEAYKGNEDNLKKGLLTGVMRVGRESIFSEWNNFDVFGITSTYFSDKFGFTKTETEKILTYFGLQNHLSKIEKWYNGYKFGNVDKIYNPWSIVSYISKVNDGFKPYWVNTGDYSLIKERITEPNVKDKIQELIEGKIIKKHLNENFVFSDFETDSELIWTLLTYNGYLTQLEKIKYGNYKLKIPNNEVKIVFTDIIMNWLNTKVKIKRDLLIRTSENLINNEIIEFENGFKQIVGDTISFYDRAEKTDKETDEIIITHEQIYHVYTLGLLAILTDDFIIKSNRESKGGRYDIMLIPHDKTKNGVVIEIKQMEKRKINEKKNNFNKRINNEIKNALAQIDINEYYTELIINKIKPENIIKLPIVFAGKEPYIIPLPIDEK